MSNKLLQKCIQDLPTLGLTIEWLMEPATALLKPVYKLDRLKLFILCSSMVTTNIYAFTLVSLAAVSAHQIGCLECAEKC